MANEVNEINWRFVARLRLAGLLVVMGLAVETATLFIPHPFSFLSFLTAGIGLVLAGVVFLVFALVAQ
jgi:hypothetical protein